MISVCWAGVWLKLRCWSSVHTAPGSISSISNTSNEDDPKSTSALQAICPSRTVLSVELVILNFNLDWEYHKSTLWNNGNVLLIVHFPIDRVLCNQDLARVCVVTHHSAELAFLLLSFKASEMWLFPFEARNRPTPKQLPMILGRKHIILLSIICGQGVLSSCIFHYRKDLGDG